MALEHLLILDLGQVFSAPYASMLLGSLGAQVIKIEAPRGEEGRVPGPPFVDDDSSLFLGANWYKRSLVLDLKTDAGQEVLARLVKRADALVHNYRPKAAQRFDLQFPRLHALNPRLVCCAVSGFGKDGPYRDRTGLDSVFQAMGGAYSINGTPEGEATKVGTPIADVSAGIYAAVGILAALVEREHTGEGGEVHLSMLDATIALQSPLFAYHFAGGIAPTRSGNDSHFAVANCFSTTDGQITVSFISQRFWDRFCDATGFADLRDDKRFATMAARMGNKNALYQCLAEIFQKRSTQAWLDLLTPEGFPCSAVNDYDAVVSDAQVTHNQTFIQGTRAGHTIKGADAPIRLGDTRTTPSPPPALGEHTEAILAELGYSDEEMTALYTAGVTKPARR